MPEPKRRRLRRLASPTLALTMLLALSLMVGAGGVGAAWGNMAVQLAALGVLAVHAEALTSFIRTAPRLVILLVSASCLLPLTQLVPLPPDVWRALPGRELLAQSLELSGGQGWYSLSLFPARTLVAFLGTLAPLAVLIVGCALPPDRIVAVQRTLVAFGAAVGLFGTTHLVDDRWGDLYASVQEMPGVLVGTFADRNAAGLFLGCCLTLLVGLPTGPRDGRDWAMRMAAGAFLLVCAILTGSRTGIALLAAPLGLLAWRVASHMAARSRLGRSKTRSLVVGLIVLLAAAVATTAVIGSGRMQTTIARIEEGNDGMRAEMREDARFAAARYWPAGAGMGTFDEVFQIDESLEYVSPRRAGRAHMDYLELAIEAGLAGLILAAGWLAWALWAGWRAAFRPGAWPARAGALVIGAIAAQSLLSFPLRNQAMLCVAAFAIVLLTRSPVVALDSEKGHRA